MRYNTPNSPMDNIRDFVYRGGIPATITLMLISTVTFLAAFFAPPLERLMVQYVAFPLGNFHMLSKAPWTMFTYPVFAGGFFSLVIGCLFFWFAGGSLERSWGTTRFLWFFFIVSAISALSLSLGYAMLKNFIGLPLMGFFLPIDALIVAVCMLNPEQTVVLYFFPIRAKYVAMLVTAFTYFSYGPILGFFACGGIIAAFLYVRYGRSWSDIGSYSRPARPGPDLYLKNVRPSVRKSEDYLDGSPKLSPFDISGRVRAWQERRRLEKLLKNSGFSEREPDWRDDEGRRRP